MRAPATAMCLAMTSCTAALPLQLDTPPLILAPASATAVVDERARFREIFCAVRTARGAAFPYDRPCERSLHRLEPEPVGGDRPVNLGQARVPLRIIVVPGVFGECAEGMARPFDGAVAPLAALAYRVTALHVSGRSSSSANAEEIRGQLAASPLRPGERLVLIGYSKGMSDVIELIAGGDRAVVPPGSAVVSLTGVVAGTPIADSGEAAYALAWRIPLPGCAPGDGGGVASITRRHRLAYAATHLLSPDLLYFSVPAFTSRKNVSSFLRGGNSALSRMDARNDGNVLFTDSIIPSSRLLGYVNSDHWALALPFALNAPVRARLFADHNDFPRVVLLEAIARAIEEHYLEAAAAVDQPSLAH